MEQGRFRLDLFYRLNGIDVQVPPLRAAKDDILELAGYFLDRYRTFGRSTSVGRARWMRCWRTTGRATCASWNG